jgi:hypothetical protein
LNFSYDLAADCPPIRAFQQLRSFYNGISLPFNPPVADICPLMELNFSFVIAKAFYPLLLIISYKLSISFHVLNSETCCGLVAGLYSLMSFTYYALPLIRILNLIFGSD